MYSLRFPFTLVHEVTGLDEPLELTDGAIYISISRSAGSFVAVAKGFLTQRDAESYLKRLWVALASYAVESGSGFQAEPGLRDTSYPEDGDKPGKRVEPPPGPIHGLGDGNNPMVYRSDGIHGFITALQPAFVSSWPRDMFGAALLRGLQLPSLGDSPRHQRLSVALDLFFTSHLLSLRGKFIVQVMALEVLGDPIERHPKARALLNRWRAEVRLERTTLDRSNENWRELDDALETLERSALFQEEESKRTRIRMLVSNGLPALGSDERAALARQVVDAYDHRGTLIHQGDLDHGVLVESWSIVQTTLQALLRARLEMPPSE